MRQLETYLCLSHFIRCCAPYVRNSDDRISRGKQRERKIEDDFIKSCEHWVSESIFTYFSIHSFKMKSFTSSHGKCLECNVPSKNGITTAPSDRQESIVRIDFMDVLHVVDRRPKPKTDFELILWWFCWCRTIRKLYHRRINRRACMRKKRNIVHYNSSKNIHTDASK